MVLWGALLPFVLRACCGGMCWPVDRPATHAAAGAAARGVFGLGDCFAVGLGAVAGACVDHGRGCERISLELRWEGKPFLRRRFRNDDEGGVVFVCSEGGCGGEVLTTGVVRHACRHRVTARGVFGLGGLFHTLGSDCTRELGLRGLIRCAGRPQEWSFGAVPPREWMARGGLVFVFSLEVAPVSEGDCFTCSGVVRHACRHRVTARGVFGFVGGVVAVCFEGLLRGHVLAGGPASHACRRRSGSTRGFWFGGLFCGWTGSCCGSMC